MNPKRKRRWLLYLAIVIVLLSSGYYLRHRLWLAKQQRYREFYAAKGLCFAPRATGIRKSWRWASVFDCEKAKHYPGEVPGEIVLNNSHDCSPVQVEFIDLNDDDIPEVHVSGLDNGTTDPEPGNNFFRYNRQTNTLLPIPRQEVPKEWRDRYPEDSECVGVWP